MKEACFCAEECNWLYVQDTSAIAADHCLGTYLCYEMYCGSLLIT